MTTALPSFAKTAIAEYRWRSWKAIHSALSEAMMATSTEATKSTGSYAMGGDIRMAAMPV